MAGVLLQGMSIKSDENNTVMKTVIKEARSMQHLLYI